MLLFPHDFLHGFHSLPEYLGVFGAWKPHAFLLKQRQDLTDYVPALPEGTKKDAWGMGRKRPCKSNDGEREEEEEGGFERRDGLMFTPGAQEEERQRRSSSLDQVLLEQSLVEQQRAGRGALLLQAEDQVPEVDPRDPLSHLPSRGRGGAGRAWRASRCLEHNETMHQKIITAKKWGKWDKFKCSIALNFSDCSRFNYIITL